MTRSQRFENEFREKAFIFLVALEGMPIAIKRE